LGLVLGGAGGASVPGSVDTVTFDGSSGGGTVTVNTTVNTLTITMGAFTGTLDFSANNNNVTCPVFSGSGTGTRTLNMGNGTWTITGGSAGTVFDMTTTTGLTFACNSSTLAFSATGSNQNRTWQTGGLTYNAVSIAESNTSREFIIAGNNATITTLTLTAPLHVISNAAITTNITNAFAFAGTAYNNVILMIGGTQGTVWTISVASGTPTFAWCALKSITCSGGATFTATNSFDLKANTGVTITGPSGGGVLYRPNMGGNMM
jgi:hypothetical protein